MRPTVLTSIHAALAGAVLFSLTACGGQADAQAGAEATPPAASADPWPQGEPEAEGQTPAFAGQTRAPALDSGVQFSAEKIAGFTNPWALAQLPDGTVLVTERGGDLYRVSPAGERFGPLGGVPAVDARNQGGLLDIAAAPDFADSAQVYFTYAEPRGDDKNGTTLARATLTESSLSDVEVLFQQQPAWDSTYHFGSNIVFAGDGTLYVGLGERAKQAPRDLSQDVGTHLGKVVRLTLDGAAAPGNPLAGQAGALPENYSYGHRNIQGAALHPETGKLWTIEHGPQGGDEINVPRAGQNHGWPVVTYGENYNGTEVRGGITQRDDVIQPIYYWDPVIAPGDMVFYSGRMLPDWRGDLLIAGLRTRSLVRLKLDGQRVVGEERFDLGIGRLRDVDVAPDGSLLVVTDEADGGLYRITTR